MSVTISGTDGVSKVAATATIDASAVTTGALDGARLPTQLGISGSASAGSLNVDASGRVTMPYQPAFLVSMQTPTLTLDGGLGWVVTTGTSGTSGGSWSWGLNSNCYNIGGHWNASNNRFTAPVSGIYQFDAELFLGDAGSAPGGTTWRFIVNGTFTVYAGSNFDQNGNSLGLSYLTSQVYMTAGDYMDLNIGYRRSGDVFGTTSYASRTHWSGRLVG